MNDLMRNDHETDSDEDVVASLQDTDVQPHPANSMASVMAKILCKNVNSSKSVILAKCKTDREIALRKKAGKGGDNAEPEPAKKLQTEKVHRDLIVKKRHWEELGHVKPNVLERDRERNLQRIATKGVVQLFNAVHKQQNLLEDKLAEAGPSERRREKAVQSLTKGKFLDMLKNVKADDDTAAVQVKTEPTDDMETTESATSWSILRDDFMMGAKMKDWDRQTSDTDMPLNRDSDDDDDNSTDNNDEDSDYS